MTVKHSLYLEALMRAVLADNSVFAMADGEIYARKPDEFIKKRLSGPNQTAIRIDRPRHVSRGTAGSEIHGIQETDAIFQIDIFSRKSDGYADQIAEILEGMFYCKVENNIDGITFYIDVERTEIQSAFQDPGVEANHAVLTLYGHYRYNTST